MSPAGCAENFAPRPRIPLGSVHRLRRAGAPCGPGRNGGRMLESVVSGVLARALRTTRLAGVAQLVEQLIRNQQVVGSSPTAGSSFHINNLRDRSAPAVYELAGQPTVYLDTAKRSSRLGVTDDAALDRSAPS